VAVHCCWAGAFSESTVHNYVLATLHAIDLYPFPGFLLAGMGHLFLFPESGVGVWGELIVMVYVCSFVLSLYLSLFPSSLPGRQTVEDSVSSAGQLCSMVQAHQTTERSKQQTQYYPQIIFK
jgi:hypothetical protein